MNRLRTIAGVLTCTVFLAGQTYANGLTLTVENVRNDRGSIIVLVFDDARAFDRLDYLNVADYAEVRARTGRLQVSFPNLTEGPYAVFLFHDENQDQDVNSRNDRLLEGIGATGAPNRDDYPSFDEAAVPAGPATVILHYDQ